MAGGIIALYAGGCGALISGTKDSWQTFKTKKAQKRLREEILKQHEAVPVPAVPTAATIDGTTPAVVKAQILPIDMPTILLRSEPATSYIAAAEKLSAASDPDELNQVLIDLTSKLKLELPWEGDFNEHMSNKDGSGNCRRTAGAHLANQKCRERHCSLSA